MSIHYENAPIAEAVIDVQCEFRIVPSLEKLKAFASELSDQFPQSQAIQRVEVAFAEQPSIRDSSQLGLRLSNADLTRVMQLRTNGISFAHLRPYSNWRAYREEFRPILQAFIERFDPVSAKRLAVRYINQIEIPSGISVEDYINIGPRLVESISQVNGYFLQLTLPIQGEGDEWGAIVNTGLLAGSTSDQMKLLLDLDVFCAHPVAATNDNSIWPILDKLRDAKNGFFEAFITEKTREIIS